MNLSEIAASIFTYVQFESDNPSLRQLTEADFKETLQLAKLAAATPSKPTVLRCPVCHDTATKYCMPCDEHACHIHFALHHQHCTEQPEEHATCPDNRTRCASHSVLADNAAKTTQTEQDPNTPSDSNMSHHTPA